MKVQILEPSGRVLPKWLHLCPSGFRKFTCVSAQISRNISMTCLLDGSRSRRSWGFPNFHGFWAAPGAIWSRLDGSKQETDCSIRNFGPCSTNSSKKIWRLLLIILLEGSKNKVEILIYNYLGEPSARLYSTLFWEPSSRIIKRSRQNFFWWICRTWTQVPYNSICFLFRFRTWQFLIAIVAHLTFWQNICLL